MATKNIFENENVKLRIINLEYSYKIGLLQIIQMK